MLPPKQPERNGGVERTNGSWRYEFYASYPLPHRLAELRPLVGWWQQIHNCLRPHQSLNHQTPAAYLRQVGHEVPDVRVTIPVSHM